MCGLNGAVAYAPSADPPDRRELIATREHMRARGPDVAGEWWSGDRRIGLGHRRLAILDLSERADQPMASTCGRYVVVFNGEIYNAPALREELEAKGCAFRTTSDTEVLLHLYALKGEAMVEDLRGMFAFAIWDDAARTLFLARDPYGIKPLYISDDGKTFRFASQVKALLAGGAVARDPDPAGVVGFHVWGSVPEPFTLHRAISALPAGHTLRVDAGGPHAPAPYGSIAQILADGAEHPAPARELDARVRDATRDSVKAHLLADVEVGVFLSAGVDSGALLGLMRDAGQDKIRAVTLAFEEFRGGHEDEAPLAGEVAALYGAEHIVRTVDEAEFRADFPALLDAMDQPSIDGVNTWFVAKAAREAGLKVALSGLGGDELLAGYPSFRQIPRWAAWLRPLSATPRAGAAARAALKALGVGARHPKALGLVEYGGTYAGAYLLRRALFLPFELAAMLDPDLITAGLERLAPLDRVRASETPAPKSPIARVAALESANYLRNQLLRDADWAGMAHSLEIRTPLVDVELLRAVSPVTPHLSQGAGKRALARAPSTPLPASIIDRAKTGFGVPTGQWLSAAPRIATARSIQEPNIQEHRGLASRQWGREVLAHAMS